MSGSHIRRQRKKLSVYKALAASSSARVLGDASFYRDFLVKYQITRAVAESVLEKLLGKKAILYTTECVRADFRYYGTILAMCKHISVTSPIECVMSVVGPFNWFNFIPATASPENAELYAQRTGRPVILGGPEGSLKVYDTGCNTHGEAEELLDGKPAKKNTLRKLFRAKALKKKKILMARKKNLKARMKISVFKLLRARNILLRSNKQARQRKTMHPEPLVEDRNVEEDAGEGQLAVNGDVLKSPASDTYVIFGEAKTEVLKSQFISPNFSNAGYNSEPAAATAQDDEDETGVDPEGIQMVMTLAAGVSRSKAVKAIKVARGDFGSAVNDLTK